MKKLLFFNVLALLLLLTSFSVMASENPIKIGASVSLEGKYKGPSLMVQNAYKLWEKKINEKGGLLKRPVKLIFYDDKSQQDLVRFNYEKLITQDKVDLIFSPYSADLTLAAAEITEKYGFVMLASGAASDEIWEKGYKYVIGNYCPATRYFIGFLDLLARNDFKTIAIVDDSTSFGKKAVQGAIDWAKRFHLKVEFTKSYKDGKSEFPDIIKELAKKNPDAFILCAYPPDSYTFLELAKNSKFKPRAKAFTIVLSMPDFKEKAGSMAEGIFGSSQWEPDIRIPFPGTKEFIKNFELFAHTIPSYHAASAYSVCGLIEKAIIETNSLDNKTIRNFIASLDTITLIGRFKIDHTGKQIGHNNITIQWQNGKKEIVYPVNMRTAQPKF